MKIKSLFLPLFSVLFSGAALAQAPQKMSYQAVVRDTGNALVTNATIGMRVSILQGSPTGTAVFVEMQTPVTNQNGLASIQIGAGTPVTGSVSSINWNAGPYYIKTETDPSGGTNYSISGTSELLSVPYALYSESVNPNTISTMNSEGKGKSVVVYTSNYAHAFYQDGSGNGIWTSTPLNSSPAGAVADTGAILIFTNNYAHTFYQNNGGSGIWTSTPLNGTPIEAVAAENILLVYTTNYAHAFYQDGSGNGLWSSTPLNGNPIGATATKNQVVIYTTNYSHAFYLNSAVNGIWTSTPLNGTPAGIIHTR